MADDVKFQEGTASKYASITPDEHSFYRTTDTDEVYLGTIKLSNDDGDINLLDLWNQVQKLQDQLDSYILGDSFVLFDNYTVSQVLTIIDQGEAENYWSVGDVTEPIPLNGTVGAYTFKDEKYKAMIIGFDHNINTETNGRHNMALQFGQNEDGVDIAFVDDKYDNTSSSAAFVMNTSDEQCGWATSYMRNTICPQFFKVLPAALQQGITATVKYTDNGAALGEYESNVTATEDKIFLPSEQEVFNSDAYGNMYESDFTKRYTWYTANATSGSSNVGIRYQHSATSNPAIWWLRTRLPATTCTFVVVNNTGLVYNNIAGMSYGFAPCFTLTGYTPIDDVTTFKPLFDCTPAEIRTIIRSGQAANMWSVGDLTAPIELNGDVSTYTFDHESFRAMLIGLDHNKDAETAGKYNACFQFGQTEDGINIAFRDPNNDGNSSASKTGFRMNSSNTNSGGWASSWMRTEILPEFLAAMPAEWQDIVGTTTKYTDNTGGTSGSEANITATEDQIFLPAETEIFSAFTYANTYEGNYTERYTWYANNDSASARIRYKHFSTSSTSIWWLRSPYRSGSTYFCTVYGSGYAYYNSAYLSYGFAPAFTVF